MSIEELKAQQTNLVLQRSQAKDVIEQVERALGQIGHTIQVLEAQAEAAKAEVIED